MKHAETDLATLKNLGPASSKWLADCGINSRADLNSLGAVMAYKIVKLHKPAANLNLLYALHAALHDLHWTAVTPEMKARLQAEAEIPLSVEPGPG